MPPKAGSRKYADNHVVRYVRSLEGEYYLPKEAAEQLGLALATVHWLTKRSDGRLGPTHQAQYGRLKIHLYTPERIEELRKFHRQVSKTDLGNYRRGPTPLWSKAERDQRFRDTGRINNYKVRSRNERAAGREAEADRLTGLAEKLATQLEEAKVQRWEKVHKRPYPYKRRVPATPPTSGS